LLDLPDQDSVLRGYLEITAKARSARPRAQILGVQVQRMLSGGQDVILGAVQDPQFGALAMFGSGGVEVEGLKDVEFGLAPLPKADAVTATCPRQTRRQLSKPCVAWLSWQPIFRSWRRLRLIP
jgi:acetyltransferase